MHALGLDLQTFWYRIGRSRSNVCYHGQLPAVCERRSFHVELSRPPGIALLPAADEQVALTLTLTIEHASI
jgi:hypothetical protein